MDDMMTFFSSHHELEMARIYGMIGNIDSNNRDSQIGNGGYSPILFDWIHKFPLSKNGSHPFLS